MNSILLRSFALFILLLGTTYLLNPVSAQQHVRSQPLSLQQVQSPRFEQTISSNKITIPAPSLDKLQAEDAANPGNSRFAAPINVRYRLGEQGTWTELANGDRIWKLELSANRALGLLVLYENFYLPQGALLHMYSPDGKQIKGGYTSANNTKTGRFLTGMIRGDEAILEYYEPAAVKGQGRFDISRVYYAYNKSNIEPSDYPFQVHGSDGFGDALSCNVNINCTEGAPWQNHKRGVMRILRIFDAGVGWCTGTLINNVRQDGTPYILSGNHCYEVAGATPMLDVWRFDFNYESVDCNNPTNEPGFASILGCEQVSNREESDFLLLRLLRSVPSSVNPYFAGWDRSGPSPQSSAGIHHPRGDIKKISVEEDPASIYPTSIVWNNNVTTPPNHHFRVEFDAGTFEDGSSGSALFDENGRIVGQLHGGLSSCTTFRGFYGRLVRSWDDGSTPESRLSDWLDPDNTGAMTIDAYEPPPTVTLSGKVEMPDGRGIGLATVYLSGDVQDSVVTDATGVYSFTVPSGGSYSLRARKNTDALNGISARDVFLINRHAIFVELFTDPLQELAGDVNDNGSISARDVFLTNRVAIFVDDKFPDQDTWGFIIPILNLNDVNDDRTGLDFVGYKVGDVNDSVDPTR